MKALVFHRPRHVSVDEVDAPRIETPRDVIVRVTASGICGADLHVFHGLLPQLHRMTLGHEIVGIVEERGAEIASLQRGDRVVVPAVLGCGRCYFCVRELPNHCEHSNPRHYGPEGGVLTEKGGAVFGLTDLYGGIPGGQAEYVRVPFADVGPRIVPKEIDDERAVFLADAAPTAWAAVERAGLVGGEVVAVMGCGPVGILAQKCAWLAGAGRVLAVDLESYRLEIAARSAHAETIDAREINPVEAIREKTAGRGADLVIDAVGMGGHRGPLDRLAGAVRVEAGTLAPLRSALSAVRRGGVVSIVGTYAADYDAFPVGQVFDKGIVLQAGFAPVHRHLAAVTEAVARDELRVDDLVTHRLPLSEAARGYEIFDKRREGCMKVILMP